MRSLRKYYLHKCLTILKSFEEYEDKPENILKIFFVDYCDDIIIILKCIKYYIIITTRNLYLHLNRNVDTNKNCMFNAPFL